MPFVATGVDLEIVLLSKLSQTEKEKYCMTAGVQPWWIQDDSKVGTESASLEKYIFNHRYRGRLETDSVVGELVEKRG